MYGPACTYILLGLKRAVSFAVSAKKNLDFLYCYCVPVSDTLSPKGIIICLVRPRIVYTQLFLTLGQPLLLKFKQDKNGYFIIILLLLFLFYLV